MQDLRITFVQADQIWEDKTANLKHYEALLKPVTATDLILLPEMFQTGFSEAVYDVLLYVANWPERRIKHWSVLLPARAIENQCYVAGLNRVGRDNLGLSYNGQSKLINLFGEEISNLSDTESVITCSISYLELKQSREKLPFLKDSNYRLFRN